MLRSKHPAQGRAILKELIGTIVLHQSDMVDADGAEWLTPVDRAQSAAIEQSLARQNPGIARRVNHVKTAQVRWRTVARPAGLLDGLLVGGKLVRSVASPTGFARAGRPSDNAA